MAVLLENPELKLKMSAGVANFVLPMLVVFVKNGSAIYISSGVMFVARATGHPLDAGSTVVMG